MRCSHIPTPRGPRHERREIEADHAAFATGQSPGQGWRLINSGEQITGSLSDFGRTREGLTVVLLGPSQGCLAEFYVLDYRSCWLSLPISATSQLFVLQIGKQ